MKLCWKYVFYCVCEKLLLGRRFAWVLVNLGVGRRTMITQMGKKSWFYRCDLCLHCHYFAIFTYAQLAARFPIGNCHLFAWNRNRNRHFFSGTPESQNPSGVSRITANFLPGILLESYNPGNPESRNPSGVSRIPATFFPGILLESATFFSGILVESATLFWNPRAYVRLWGLSNL